MPDPMIDLVASVLATHDLIPGTPPDVICRCGWEPEWGRDAPGFWIEQYDHHRAEALSHSGLLIWPPPICLRCHKQVTPAHVATSEWAGSRHCADCPDLDR